MFYKKLTREEVLEILMMMASKSIPENLKGEMSADLYSDGTAEIFFTPDTDGKELN
jgi:hypothetical protein